MGRLFLVDLDFDDQYFHGIVVCHACHTHVAALREYQHFAIPEDILGPTFSKVVNVQVDGPENHRDVGTLTLASVYCVKCGERLGVKYIKDTCTVDGHVSEAGCYNMLVRKLSMWNGNEYWGFEHSVYQGHLPD